MARWKTPFLTVAALAALAAPAADTEPYYGGHPFSYWANKLPYWSMDSSASPPPEVVAIQQIGSNAIPALLKWLLQKNPPDYQYDRPPPTLTTSQPP